jgi:hypothetical protein
MAVALLALFVSLGGVSYGVATHSIGAKALKTGAVGTRAVKNKSLRGGDLRSNTLGGKQIKESALGKVPLATSADRATSAGHADTAGHADSATNADKLGGAPASDFDLPTRVLYGRGDATSTTQLPLLSFPAMGMTVTTDGDGDNTPDVRVHNTRAPTGGDLKVSLLDPTTDGSGNTITPGTDHEVTSATTSSLQFIVTSNNSAQAMMVTCKVNNHGGGDENVHCIGVRSP